jgi:uncharacterized membrane protein YphA (DoxX/SURF4 family)
MGLAYHLANAVSILLFLYYGLICLFAEGMIEEFHHFGIPQFRRLTGVLETLGAIGLACGYAFPFLVAPSAGGLALLMLLGIAVRVKVRDTLVDILPAGFLLVITAFIAVQAILR